jgi:citrate lyase beta subunit
MLFVPGDDPEKVAKALASDADAVIVDLEDGVAPERKEIARAETARLTASGPAGLTVRINDPRTPDGIEDLRALHDASGVPLVVPKCELTSLGWTSGRECEVVALVETARGVREAYELACHPSVSMLQLGGEDLSAELGLVPFDHALQLAPLRSRLAVDSAAAGLRPPVDTIVLDWRDAEALRADALAARALGMGAKACIHPAQLAVVNDVFTASAQERAWAESMLRTFDGLRSEGRAVGSTQGEMVDVAVARRARRLLAGWDEA